MRIETRNIDELLPADYNPREKLKAGDPEYEKLKRSIETFGIVEPIIFNERTGNVVGGHQRQTVLKDLGYKEIEVSIVDLSPDEEKALNVALNKISGDWDSDKLVEVLLDLRISDIDETLTGFDFDEIESLLFNGGEEGSADGESQYTEKIETPTYEPTELEKPSLDDIYNSDKAKELIVKIDKANISEEEKTFLKFAAFRHIVFDYHNIAEYYAHSGKEMQELMEDSALVIIDFNKAIENGFIQFATSAMESLEDDENE